MSKPQAISSLRSMLSKFLNPVWAILVCSLLGSCTKQSPPQTNPIYGNGEGVMGVVATYDNTRIRCDFERKSSMEHDVRCFTVAMLASGEVKAESIANDLTIKWFDPKQISGSKVQSLTCSGSENGLEQNCHVTLSENGIVEIEHSIELKKTLIEEIRLESTTVTLPYSVQTYGVIPSMTVFEPRTMNQTEGSSTAGIQAIELPSIGSPLGQINRMCVAGATIYFQTNGRIYRYRNGSISVFAGYENSGATLDLSHRLRFNTIDGRLMHTCDSKSILFQKGNFLYQILEEGPIKILAGGGNRGKDNANLPVAQLSLTQNGQVLDVFARKDGGWWMVNPCLINRIDSKGINFPVSGGACPLNTEIFTPDTKKFRVVTATVAADDSLWIVDSFGQRMIRFSPEGTRQTPYSAASFQEITLRPDSTEVSFPTAISLTAGPNGSLYLLGGYPPRRRGEPAYTVLYELSNGERKILASTNGATHNYDINDQCVKLDESIPLNFSSFPFFGTFDLSVTKEFGYLIQDGHRCRIFSVNTDQTLATRVLSSTAFEKPSLIHQPLSKTTFSNVTSLVFQNEQLLIGSKGALGPYIVSPDKDVFDQIPIPSLWPNQNPGGHTHYISQSPSGNLFVHYQHSASKIMKIDKEGTATRVWSSERQSTGPIALVPISDEEAYVVFRNQVSGVGFYKTIEKINFTTQVRVHLAGRMGVGEPFDIAEIPTPAKEANIDPNHLVLGRDGALYFASRDRIYRVTALDSTPMMVSIGGILPTEFTNGMGVINATYQSGYIGGIALDENNDLYVTGGTQSLVRKLKRIGQSVNGTPLYESETLFKKSSARDCSGGISKRAKFKNLSEAEQIVSNLCSSWVGALAVRSSCSEPNGKIEIAFSQWFENDSSNVIVLTRPCTR